MTDVEYEAAEARYREHMARFLKTHPPGSPAMDALRRMERLERWEGIMGPLAQVVPPPPLDELAA